MLARNVRNRFSRPAKSFAAHQAAQLPALRRDRDVRCHRLQQKRVQAALHLLVRVVQLVEANALVPFLGDDGQVAGLEQERLDGNAVDVDGRQQIVIREHALQGRRRDTASRQKVGEEGRRAGPEPVRFELARFEEKKDVERVVDLVCAAPVVAVVPELDFLPIQAPEFRGENRVQLRVRVAANVRELRRQRDVAQVVQAREQACLRELAHPRQEKRNGAARRRP